MYASQCYTFFETAKGVISPKFVGLARAFHFVLARYFCIWSTKSFLHWL